MRRMKVASHRAVARRPILPPKPPRQAPGGLSMDTVPLAVQPVASHVGRGIGRAAVQVPKGACPRDRFWLTVHVAR